MLDFHIAFRTDSYNIFSSYWNHLNFKFLTSFWIIFELLYELLNFEKAEDVRLDVESNSVKVLYCAKDIFQNITESQVSTNQIFCYFHSRDGLIGMEKYNYLLNGKRWKFSKTDDLQQINFCLPTLIIFKIFKRIGEMQNHFPVNELRNYFKNTYVENIHLLIQTTNFDISFKSII